MSELDVYYIVYTSNGIGGGGGGGVGWNAVTKIMRKTADILVESMAAWVAQFNIHHVS